MGQHAVHVLGKQAQQFVFHGSQVQLLAVERDRCRGVVNDEAVVNKLRLLRGRVLRAVAQMTFGRAEPCQQLANGEGLCDVVVCPRIEGLDLVGVVAACAQNDDGHV